MPLMHLDDLIGTIIPGNPHVFPPEPLPDSDRGREPPAGKTAIAVEDRHGFYVTEPGWLHAWPVNKVVVKQGNLEKRFGIKVLRGVSATYMIRKEKQGGIDCVAVYRGDGDVGEMEMLICFKDSNVRKYRPLLKTWGRYAEVPDFKDYLNRL